jgi:H+/Cl- antiporter ClcA
MMAWCYNRWGKEAGRGNDLILERIRLQNGKVPPQMTPLIFGGSVLSHLVGASTGREGAAVQMGGGVAALLLQLTKLPPSYSRALLVAGVAAGFSSIFGTPLAGAVFAVEAAAPAQPLYRMLPIALTASFAGDFVCRAWGAKHAVYPIPESWGPALFTLKTLGALLLAGFIFGWAGRLFVSLHHGIRALYTRLSPHWWVPPLSGGLLLIGASQVPFFQDFLGLGTWSMRPEAVTIASAFAPGGATDFSWLLKLSLTALSLGAGFKGGEVTPLFFVGATLGNVVASHLHLDPSLFAALGFVSVFAGAAHTPLTGTLVAAELFGLSVVPLFAPVCWIAHRACGNAGIYSGQFPVAPSRPSSRARFEARQK